jgi:hypothetical protein
MFWYIYTRSIPRMNLNTVQAFRHGLYECLQRGADGLFNTADALLSQPQAQSLAQLSLSPFFQRGWSSLYQALQDGRIATGKLEELFATFAPTPPAGEPRLLGLDSSSIARPLSPTAADRTLVYVPNLPNDCTPVTPGWQFSAVVALPQVPSSWDYLLSHRRIASTQTAGQVGAEQLREVIPRLGAEGGERAIVVADRSYGNAPFLQESSDVACDKLIRLAKNRVFYRPAPARTGKRGAPCKDGPRFKCDAPQTHGPPDGVWEGQDEKGHRLQVEAWEHLHLKQAREIEGTVIRVTRFGAADTQRDPRVSWFFWIGQAPAPLARVWSLYKRRYSHEHGYRFQKQALLWDQPRLRTPEQFERWTLLVAAVQNQLVLARPLVAAVRLPWESSTRPVTPQQVRRAMAPILVTLGTPAHAPKVRGKSPGWSKGRVRSPAPRFLVVKKPTPVPKKRRKRA